MDDALVGTDDSEAAGELAADADADADAVVTPVAEEGVEGYVGDLRVLSRTGGAVAVEMSD